MDLEKGAHGESQDSPDRSLIAGRFETEATLGEGPLGKVYRAVDHNAGPGRTGQAALRILRADAVDDALFDRNCEELVPRLRELCHPGLHPLLAAGRTRLGLPYIATDFAEGEDLRQLIADQAPLPASRVCTIGQKLVAALSVGHSAELPHGNLHPGNVLLVRGKEGGDPFAAPIRLLDYGVLELTGSSRPREGSAYRAPELHDGQPATLTSDLYSAAAVLWELLFGAPPSAAEELEWPEEDDWLAALLARALSVDPADRFQDAGAFLAALSLPPPSDDPVMEFEGASPYVPSTPEDRMRRRARIAEDALGSAGAKLLERERELETLRGRLDETSWLRAELSLLRGEKRAWEAEREELTRTRDAALKAAPPASLMVRPQPNPEPEPPAVQAPTEPDEAEPARGGGAAIAFALFGLAMTALWWRERSGSDEASAADGPTLASRVERAEEELALAGEQREQLARDLEAALADAELQGDSAERLEDELETARVELDSVRTSLEAMGEESRARETELAALRAQLDATNVASRRSSEPTLAMLDEIDLLLDSLSDGDGGAARARYQLLSRNARGVPGLPSLKGLDGLTRAAEALDRPAVSSDLIAQLDRLGAARAGMEDAGQPRALPALIGSAWIVREGVERARSLESAVGRIESRIAVEADALAPNVEARWNELTEAGLSAPPEEVAAIAARLDGDRLEDFVDHLVDSIRASAEPAGELDIAALSELSGLEAWSAFTAEHPTLRDGAAAGELAFFHFAQAWHVASPSEVPAAPPTLLPTAPAAGRTDWRAELVLRASLADDGSAWPGGVGARALFLSTAELGGDTTLATWQLDEVRAVEDDEGTGERVWTLQRSFFRLTGEPLNDHTVRIVRQGRRFYEVGRQGGALLDLTSPELSLAEHAPPGEAPPLPPQLVERGPWEPTGADGEAVAAFAGGGVTARYSPRWGCLAVEDPGRFRRELIYAAPVSSD